MRTGGGISGGSAVERRAALRPAITGPAAICAGLLIVILYAAFAHGGVALADATRVELGVAVVGAAAGAVLLWTGALLPSVPALATAGAVLLGLFACWDGVTLAWSVAPNQTWIELNRVIAYVTVLVVAIATGAAAARTLDLVRRGFLVVALLVTAYAVGQKVLPGLHVGGLFDLNQNGPLPRLQEPFGYWNALALFIVLAVPLALSIAADDALGPRTRVGALCASSLMLITIVFTYSRGGLIALAVAVAVAVAISGGQRLQWLAWVAAALLGAVPATVFGLLSGPLNRAGASLSSREGAGAILLVLLVISLAGLSAAGMHVIRLEPRLRVDEARGLRLRRLGWAVTAVAVITVLLAVTFSSRGLTGTVSHAWHTFTTTRATSNYDPHRLLSADSENRWVWWKEAAGAFGDRPLGGWGAGSFGVVHLLYRRDTLSVQQPHSVPLQFLSDSGIVGALLAIVGYLLLLRAGARAVRRMLPGSRRMAAAALYAGAVAYGVHALYDWDWGIPGVTLPALLFLGLVAGGAGRFSRLDSPAPRSRSAWRLPALATLTLWLSLVGLSAELPERAESDANSALVQAANSSVGALAAAQSSAVEAARLDPLSDAGPLAEETIALHRGRVVQARRYVQEALSRNPSDQRAWAALVFVDTLLGERSEAAAAVQRIADLDPLGGLARFELASQLLSAPPGDSATSVRTPGSHS
jgi:hypothetical protein